MSIRSAAIIVALSTAIVGCVTDKGNEEDPLVDGKADSFYSPTPHGQLLFGPPNTAEITAAAKYHAWTFNLGGPARIALKTDVSTNLDTVMYLYRRDAGSTGSFGAYIAKNDDHGDDIWSEIDLEAEPGEYRMIVKAFKSAELGGFSLLGTCDGAGCPGPVACFSDEFDPLPDSAATLSASCATELLGAFTTRTSASNTVTVAETQICTIGAAGKRSVDQYRAYWDEVEGWDAFKNDELDISLEITTETRGDQTEVRVDAPFDEDAISLTYGNSGRLLTLYQDNQSPDARVYCDETGTIAAPDTSCIEYMRAALAHAEAEMTGTKTTTCHDAASAGLPPLIADPICEFTGKHGLSDTVSVSVAYRTWRSDAGLLGAEVKLTSGTKSETYVLGTTSRETTQIFATMSGTDIDLTCYEL